MIELKYKGKSVHLKNFIISLAVLHGQIKSIGMNKKNWAASVCIAMIFASCADKEPEQDRSLMDSTSALQKTAAVIDTPQMIRPDSAAAMMPAVQTTVPQNVVSTSAAPGMNPAHGQPGHRCDIAVGAPLNSAPAKPATPTVQTTPAIATPTATAAKTKTAPGMNPPHGEPGHRCDIAVGAPLNSPPAAKPEIKPAAPVVLPLKDTAG
jgi:hypothetical protein